MQTGATYRGFRILGVPNPTNWRAVPLGESFELEKRKSFAPLVAIMGDNGPTIKAQYHEGVVEYDHVPTAESLDNWYRSHWMGQTFEQVRAQAEGVSKCVSTGVRLQLLQGLENLDSAMDVGAGYGDQVRSLQAIAKSVTVVEPCEVRAQVLREVYGCNTLLGSFPDVTCRADLIVCHHVIEHVRDAEQVFAGFAACQPRGGRLAITCPNFLQEPKIGVCLFWPHLRSFTEAGLVQLAALYGYRLELDLSDHREIAMRFVRDDGAAELPEFLPFEQVLWFIRNGLGLGSRRLLIWERDFDGAVHVDQAHAIYRNRFRCLGRMLEIEDIAERKTDCPLEIQWVGATQVFVK